MQLSFPYEDCSLARRHDYYTLNQLREKICHMQIENSASVRTHELFVRRKGHPTQLYRFKVGDEVIQAPLGLFFPNLFGAKIGEGVLYDELEDTLGDGLLIFSTVSELIHFHSRFTLGSIFTVRFNPAHSTLQEADPAPPTSIDTLTSIPDISNNDGSETESDDAAESGAAKRRKVEEPFPSHTQPMETAVMGIDEAVVAAIMACRASSLQKRLFNNIVVCGGCTLMKGFVSMLQSRIIEEIRRNHIQMEYVTIIHRPKDLDPRVIAWKGASVLGRLASAQDAAITASEWRYHGLNAVRAKAPFII